MLSQGHRRSAGDISAGATGNDTANRWRSAHRGLQCNHCASFFSPVVNPPSGHQAQPLHVEDDGLQHPRQRVGEGNLCRHLLTHCCPAHWLRERETQLSSTLLFFLLNKGRGEKQASCSSTLMTRSGVLSRKLNWVATTCWVSLTRPDSVSIRAAWSINWSL